jgi:hypothetical protein
MICPEIEQEPEDVSRPELSIIEEAALLPMVESRKPENVFSSGRIPIGISPSEVESETDKL